MDTTVIDDLKTRYARQMSLPEVGEEGQMRLAGKRVAVIGSIAAAEALKLLLDLPSPLTEGLLLIDSLQLSFQLIHR